MPKLRSCMAAAVMTLSVIAQGVAQASSPVQDSKLPRATEEERNYYQSVVVPALTLVKRAMPSPPAGWEIADETKIEASGPGTASGDMRRMQFSYSVTFQRTTGVREERKKLRDAFQESSKVHEEQARPRIEELIKKQQATSLALRKATRRRNQAAMDRLNNELDANGVAMKALHDEVDGQIAKDIEPLLVKDAEATITVVLNGHDPVVVRGESMQQPKAAAAFRSEGVRSGPMSWREGESQVLYGGWDTAPANVFRPREPAGPFPRKASTILIIITADKARAGLLLQRMDLRSIQTLLDRTP